MPFQRKVAEGQIAEPNNVILCEKLFSLTSLTAEQVAEAQRRAREWTPTPE